MNLKLFIILTISIATISARDTVNDVAFFKLGSYSGRDDSFYKKSYFIPKYFTAKWVNARSVCQSFYMEFVSFETLSEANAVTEMCKNNSEIVGGYAMIGGMILSANSTTDWYWVNSGNHINYTIPWASGQPNFFNDEQCMGLKKDASYSIHDIPCTFKSKFICERYEQS